MVHLCKTLMNGLTGPMSFLKNSFPHAIYNGNTQPSLKPQDTIPQWDWLIKLTKNRFVQHHQWLIKVLFVIHLNNKRWLKVFMFHKTIIRRIFQPHTHSTKLWTSLTRFLFCIYLLETHYPLITELENPQPRWPCRGDRENSCRNSWPITHLFIQRSDYFWVNTYWRLLLLVYTST